MPETPRLTAPTVRGTYGVLLGAGAVVLSLGLLLPFVVAESPKESLSSGGPAAGEATTGSAGPGTTAATPTVTAGHSLGPGGGPAPGEGASGSTSATTGGTGATSGGLFPGTGGSGVPAAQRKASDVGITRDTVKLGVLIPADNSSSESETSFSDVVGDPKKQWKAYIDEVNAKGGILGRRIVPVYREYDGLDLDAQRAACVYLTEQAKVFAIVNSGGFYGDPILCVTQQHRTPFLGQAGEALDFYQKSRGLYFSTTPNKDRVLQNMVASATRDDVFKGKTIGLLSREGIDAIPVDRSLKPALKAADANVVARDLDG
jgi:ABC-type branched-subunit amino acid transport system substrate-binding protein